MILWSADQLQPYLLYERPKVRLGGEMRAISLSDMANVTQRLYFS